MFFNKKISYNDLKRMRPWDIASKIKNKGTWYEYVTSLRGPDIPDKFDTAKMVFNSLLRGNTYLFELHLNRKELFSQTKNTPVHWKSHIYSGLEAMSTVADNDLQSIITFLKEMVITGSEATFKARRDGLLRLLKNGN